VVFLFLIIDPVNLKGYISRGEFYEAMYRDNMLKTANSKKIRSKKMDLATKCAILATEDFSRAIHIRPSNYLLYLYRGRILLKQGKVEEATFDFHAAFNLNKSIAHTFIQALF
jgi:tetratricopeptide (TPR) repeat protein